MVAGLAGNINSGFIHDFYGEGRRALRLGARAEGLEAPAAQRAQPAFGHLAAEFVVGADE